MNCTIRCFFSINDFILKGFFLEYNCEFASNYNNTLNMLYNMKFFSMLKLFFGIFAS